MISLVFNIIKASYDSLRGLKIYTCNFFSKNFPTIDKIRKTYLT